MKFKNIIRLCTHSIFLILFIFSCNCSYSSGLPKNLIVSNDIDNHQITDEKGQLLDVGLVCSLAIRNKYQLIFANYHNIYLMNLKTGTTKLVNKPNNINIWFPTGLKWCEETQRLYIANYIGKDILVVKFNEKDDLILEKRFLDKELEGPENIDVIEGGKLFAVADYDGNKVHLFNDSGKIWSREVGRAHGISFSLSKNFILASGLNPGSLYMFDLHGNLVHKAGEEGWGKNGYLWPTSIAVSEHFTCVSDAHTGKISFIDKTLDFKRSIGGNGLGIDLFNMPYSVVVTSDGALLVADTFKGRILKIDPLKNLILANYTGSNLCGVHTTYCSQSEIKRSNNRFTLIEPLGINYKHRVNTTEQTVIKFNGLKSNNIWNSSYNKLVDKQGRVLSFNGSPLFSNCQFYWISSKSYISKGLEFTILGSPQAHQWLVLHKGIVCPIAIGLDFWIKGDSLISTKGDVVTLSDLSYLAKKKIDAYDKSVRSGVNPLDAMAEYLFEKKDFLKGLELTAASEKGHELIRNLIRSDNILDQQQAAIKYLDNIENDNYLYFFELAIASTVLYNKGMD